MIFSHAMLRHRYHSSYYRVLIRQYAYVNDLICAHAYSEIRCCKSIHTLYRSYSSADWYFCTGSGACKVYRFCDICP